MPPKGGGNKGGDGKKARRPRKVEDVHCGLCNKKIKFGESYKQHLRNTCAKSRVAESRKAGVERVFSGTGISSHPNFNNKKTGVGLQCNLCGKATTYKDAMKKHVKETHVDINGVVDTEPGYDDSETVNYDDLGRFAMPGVIDPQGGNVVKQEEDDEEMEEEDEDAEGEDEEMYPQDPYWGNNPGGHGGMGGAGGAGGAAGATGIAPYGEQAYGSQLYAAY